MSTIIKYSRQRESIKDFLVNSKEHPTADMVYQHVREIYPKISLGTVYRNLGLLIELGEVKKFDYGDGSDRYDANKNPHYHVICTECNKVEDLEMNPMDHINVIAGVHSGSKITRHHAMFYGICEECLKKEASNSEEK